MSAGHKCCCSYREGVYREGVYREGVYREGVSTYGSSPIPPRAADRVGDVSVDVVLHRL